MRQVSALRSPRCFEDILITDDLFGLLGEDIVEALLEHGVEECGSVLGSIVDLCCSLCAVYQYTFLKSIDDPFVSIYYLVEIDKSWQLPCIVFDVPSIKSPVRLSPFLSLLHER